MRSALGIVAAVLSAVVGCLLVGAPAGAVPSGSVGPGDSGYLVTFAARQCSSFGDVRANRARNNVMESLENLGPPTNYGGSEPIKPTREDAAPQSSCAPLVGWQFTLGAGLRGGTPSNLSVVTSPDSTPVVTKSSETLRDAEGNTVGSIAGAATIELTAAQLARAGRGGLWVQGGTPADPLLNGVFPGQFGFAALRCAVDNVNGDNVEFVAFPSRQHHVFCYAYYINPPPGAGTIVVRKQLVSGGTSSVTFPFAGTASYNPGGAFGLTVRNGQPASQTFVRAEGIAWEVTERPTAGWAPAADSPACTSGGGSQTSISGQTATITLVAGDTVTCTYANQMSIPGLLEIDKRTQGAVGGPFAFTITPPDAAPQNAAATTTEEGVPVDVADFATPGDYTISEADLPQSGDGTWELTDVTCGGAPQPVTAGSVTITVGTEPVDCTFTDTFTPTGSITIDKVTEGGVGSFAFVVEALDGDTLPDGERVLAATTLQPGAPTAAAGDDLTGLPLGSYQIIEIPPPSTTGGVWTGTQVACDTADIAPTEAFGVSVELTRDHPHVNCTLTNTLDPPGTLQVVKQVAGDPAGRTGDVAIDIACDDGTAATLTLPAGQPGPAALPAPLQFLDSTHCTITETAPGAAPGASVATTTRAATNAGQVIADGGAVGSSRVDLQACKLEYSIVSPK